MLAFNLFLSEGVLPRVQSAIEGFRARGAKAIVLDLRGNPGGQGAVAIPIAARLTDKPLTLGTLQFRDFDQTFTAAPPMGVKPFTGTVVIVTDEGTASTAEIFAAGLQEAGRALVVGDSHAGRGPALARSSRCPAARSCSTWWRTSARPRACCSRAAGCSPIGGCSRRGPRCFRAATRA